MFQLQLTLVTRQLVSNTQGKLTCILPYPSETYPDALYLVHSESPFTFYPTSYNAEDMDNIYRRTRKAHLYLIILLPMPLNAFLL